ncbi:hypothetical protein V1477_007538 [Vespula maculifrons]|uniref:Uncharacterized protein n=1 Tax=Vespula maculifrons TaxID=7453 RepID=A0ABD2CIW6_VESMC
MIMYLFYLDSFYYHIIKNVDVIFYFVKKKPLAETRILQFYRKIARSRSCVYPRRVRFLVVRYNIRKYHDHDIYIVFAFNHTYCRYRYQSNDQNTLVKCILLLNTIFCYIYRRQHIEIYLYHYFYTRMYNRMRRKQEF